MITRLFCARVATLVFGIAYAIAVPEMLYVANQIWSDELNVPEMMNVLLIVYVSLVGILVWVMGRWERALRIPGYTSA